MYAGPLEKLRNNEMEQLNNRTAQEVLDEHQELSNEWKDGFLEWAYEDDNVRIRDGADSYLIEDGKIIVQTIHYTMEAKQS
jgi:hypothetical protein